MIPFSRLSGRTAILLAAGALAAATPDVPRIPYQSFTLSNGLRVLVHEDHKAPIVAVNVWYHVGSKNEKPGRTGFAHLFEHLMFNGSEHHNTDYFKVLEKIGATDLNGTTNNDRTNYFQNVPTSALDTVMWMESDRMGHLLGAIDQARLDEQRGVVQNEKRQGENQPYGRSFDLLTEALFPVGHPYHWTVIGSMDDLNAASLADVKEWFRTYYGPNNATLVLAGDIDLKTAKEKAEKYFGALTPNAPVSRMTAWAPKTVGHRRLVMEDRVPQAAVFMGWVVPELTHADTDRLDTLATVLGGGRTSRLYRRLVEQEQLATQAGAFCGGMEIAGFFGVQAMARPGASVEKIEAIIREELDKILKEGPTTAELDRVRAREYAQYIRGIERIGGFGGKSDKLASGLVLAGDPEWERKGVLEKYATTPEQVAAAGRAWLGEGSVTLEVRPFQEAKAAAQDADRKAVPEVGPAPSLAFPKLQRATLPNGLKVVLAERHEAPVVSASLMIEGGTAVDAQLSSGAGTASLAMRMMDEGTEGRSAAAVREALEGLGANVRAGASTNAFFVNLNTLKMNLGQSMELFADVTLHPAFPAKSLDRLKRERLAQIAQEENGPESLAYRVTAPILFGAKHPYGNPITGSGFKATVEKLKVEDVKAVHQAWFKPGSATLVVTGDITLKELMPLVEQRFGSWAKGQAPKVNIPTASNPDATVIYLVDKPGAIQSVVNLAAVAPARQESDEPAVDAMQTILGGMFMSRVNMNLREDKHWTYGASAGLFSTRGVRAFFAGASVQTDKTAESLTELQKEMDGMLGSRPVTAEELAFAKKNMTLSLPGSFETAAAVSGGIREMLTWNLKDDHYQTYVGRVTALREEDVTKAARKVIPTKGRVFVVVGDRSKVEEPLRKLGIGEVRLVDTEGRPVK